MNSFKKYVSLVLAAALVLTGINVTDAKAETAKYETKEVTVAASSAAVTTTVAVKADVKVGDDLVAVVSPAATTVVESKEAKVVTDGSVDVTFTVAKNATAQTVVLNVCKKGAEKSEVVSTSAVTTAKATVVDEKDVLAAVKVTITNDSKEVVKKTKKITVKTETPVYVKQNGKATVKVNLTKASGADEAAALKATIKNKKVVKSVTVNGNKVVINAAKKATKGSSTIVTLKSEGASNVKVKVFVKNPAKKIKAKKAKATVKKKKTVKVTYKTTTADKKKVVDKITVTFSKKKVVKATKTKVKKGQIVVTLKGLKKGTTKVTLKAGSKKAKAVKVTVK